MLNNVLGRNIFIMHKKIYHHNSFRTLETNGVRNSVMIADNYWMRLSENYQGRGLLYVIRWNRELRWITISTFEVTLKFIYLYFYKAISGHEHNLFRQTSTLLPISLEISKHSHNGQVDWRSLFMQYIKHEIPWIWPHFHREESWKYFFNNRAFNPAPCNLRLLCALGLNNSQYTYSSLMDEKQDVPGSVDKISDSLKGMCYRAKMWYLCKTVVGKWISSRILS